MTARGSGLNQSSGVPGVGPGEDAPAVGGDEGPDVEVRADPDDAVGIRALRVELPAARGDGLWRDDAGPSASSAPHPAPPSAGTGAAPTLALASAAESAGRGPTRRVGPDASPGSIVRPRPARAGLPRGRGGILLSRLAGLLREKLLAFHLGTGLAAEAFRAALRIPNLLQNLLGDGVLTGAFVPTYARLLRRRARRGGGTPGGCVASLLVLVTGALVVVGVLLAEPLTRILTPGSPPAPRRRS
jgi:hypothetical protein